MTDHNWPIDSEERESSRKQGCLRRRSPGMTARTFAVAKTWAVERDRATGARRLVKYATDQHVLDHDAVPMQEHHRRSVAVLDAMQSVSHPLRRQMSQAVDGSG